MIIFVINLYANLQEAIDNHQGTYYNNFCCMNVRLAQLDRAFGYGPKGRGFESSSARGL